MSLDESVPAEFVGKFLELMTFHGRHVDAEMSEIRMYWSRLKDKASLPILVAAVERAIDTRKFFPRVPELLEDAEACRAQLSASVAFTPCFQCRDIRPGWIAVRDPGGVLRQARCDCWHDHQKRLAGEGISPRPIVLQLEAAAGGDE